MVRLHRQFERVINVYSDIFAESDEQFVKFVFRLISRRLQYRNAAHALRLLFSLDSMLYDAQGQLAIAYDDGVHTKHRHLKYHDYFTSRINESDQVLDIGCGIGAVAFDVAKIAERVVGVDIDEEYIASACEMYQRPNLEFRVVDALEALPDEKFSLIILSNVLEHLSGRSKFLRQIKGTFQPERILINVPLFERDWRVPLKRELGVEWRLDDTHEIEYTLEAFSEEMEEAGLEINHLEVRWGEIWTEVS